MHRALLVSAFVVALAASCQSTGSVARIDAVATEADRESMTPDAALAALKEGNIRFVTSSPLPRNLKAQMESAAQGAFPFAAVLSTVDSRVPLPMAFDAGIGDVVCVRTRGCVANDNAVAALEDAVAKGVKVIVVLDHSDGPHRLSSDFEIPTESEVIRGGLSGVGSDQPLRLEGVAAEDAYAVIFAERVADSLLAKSPGIYAAAEQGRVTVVAGFYDIPSGAIVWL